MGGSWEAAVSGARGACVRVWPVLQAVRRVCVWGGAQEGRARPCHAGCRWPRRRRRGGRGRGAGCQGGSVTRPAGQTEVAVFPAARDGGTDHPEHPPR